MSTSAARVTSRRAAMDRKPVHEQRRIRAEEARQFEEARKSLVKRVALKVGRFFKKVAAKVAATAARVATAPKRALVAFAHTPTGQRIAKMRTPVEFVADQARRVGRFFKKHWAEVLASTLFMGALVIAPATTLVAAVFIAASYAIARVDSPFARFVAHVFFRAGVETFAEGLAFAVVFRDRR